MLKSFCRLNTNSLVEPINQLELQAQPPFLLYKNERSKIRGFWFYNSSDCEKIARLISQLSEKINDRLVSEAPKSLNVSKNVLSLLDTAQKMTMRNENDKNIVQGKAFTEINNLSVKEFFAALPLEATGFHILRSDHIRSDHPPVISLCEIEKIQQNQQAVEDILFDKGNSSNEKEEKPSSLTALFSTSKNMKLNKNLSESAPIENLKKDNTGKAQTSSLTSSKNSNSSTRPALMPPTMFTSNESSNHLKKLSELTKDQMLQALCYLIQNDTEFHEKLYEAFKKTIKSS